MADLNHSGEFEVAKDKQPRKKKKERTEKVPVENGADECPPSPGLESEGERGRDKRKSWMRSRASWGPGKKEKLQGGELTGDRIHKEKKKEKKEKPEKEKVEKDAEKDGEGAGEEEEKKEKKEKRKEKKEKKKEEKKEEKQREKEGDADGEAHRHYLDSEAAEEIIQRQRQLEQFLLTSNVKRLRGTTWKYFDINPQQKEVVLFLHSGGVRPEAHFEHFAALSKEYRVVAPWMPVELKEVEDFAEGLLLILRHEKIREVHLFGVGFGALVATYLMFIRPERVLSATLALCDLPDENLAKKFERASIKLKKDQHYGPDVMRVMAGCAPKDLAKQVPDLRPGEVEFWTSVLKRFKPTQEAVASRAEATRALHASVSYDPADFSDYAGPVLLIEADGDKSFSRPNVEQLKGLFTSDPSVHMFRGVCGSVVLVRGEIVSDLVLKFIKGGDNSEKTNTETLSSRGVDDTDATLTSSEIEPEQE
eukprot:TRINITY_DN12645_c0_g1_i1.p1 TRINITY_DN12645_c0_g1~~TRINITY_DN12645_c0_g1_i1.p1  ORF type:complete len:478 (-),score=178.82 TRINITY_DN12645_c0_g1_i1:61-1494(-)